MLGSEGTLAAGRTLVKLARNHQIGAMPRRDGYFSVSTLQDHLDTGHSLTLHCRCGRSRALSLPRLIEIFGPDFEIVANREKFLGRFVCNECGQRPNQITLGTPNTPRW
ncbi:hypothetical protein [Pelagibacterium halotolerans]|uniref:Uncharacterized protein n=1 Tax=Pelagibacterium halotolerans (strain DSM 22347 / JCM 15775 / CGMCC 1.7692 / B2) TaxID=1082931 RepID=G4RDC6_PELHB|nr:hypothetical protein [Pelagibacterium halotolerans]AEQ50752.1 hypothetical protein KKY_713 [Pelagibacterium halotolerans B2]QJR19328.1 hypothetical protein HKM20_13295 [Pelagibacterium halotolerans]SDZ94867.1 hypothetical protein SAMN05428936_101639 [Pelagibacterium halotolerans]